jgi:di/tricarboxylate transporter
MNARTDSVLKYQAINWTVIFLVAAILPMGTALVNTGLASLIGEGVAEYATGSSAFVLISILYLTTTILTEVMSNNSTAVLMVPIALSVAQTMGLEPFALVMAVAFGASASFLTPMGYKTNAMVYGPGGYRFMDYIRFGAPLKVVFWLISALLVPRFWPLTPV